MKLNGKVSVSGFTPGVWGSQIPTRFRRRDLLASSRRSWLTVAELSFFRNLPAIAGFDAWVDRTIETARPTRNLFPAQAQPKINPGAGHAAHAMAGERRACG